MSKLTVKMIVEAAGGVGELARKLGVDHSTVCEWLRHGRVPSTRVLAMHDELGLPLCSLLECTLQIRKAPNRRTRAPALDMLPKRRVRVSAAATA